LHGKPVEGFYKLALALRFSNDKANDIEREEVRVSQHIKAPKYFNDLAALEQAIGKAVDCLEKISVEQ
jgi:hypothetical protein